MKKASPYLALIGHALIVSGRNKSGWQQRATDVLASHNLMFVILVCHFIISIFGSQDKPNLKH